MSTAATSQRFDSFEASFQALAVQRRLGSLSTVTYDLYLWKRRTSITVSRGLDPQKEKPSAADRKAFGAIEARATSDPDAGVARWKDAAHHGDVVAMNELGNCFASGEGVDVDRAEALRWYEGAAAKDFVPALINLAECYRNGDGVARDVSVAARLYERACAKDKCVPAFALGEMHRDGEGVTKSLDRAEEYFVMARANRHPEAYIALKAIGRTPRD